MADPMNPPAGGTPPANPPAGGTPPAGDPPAGAWYDSFQDVGVKDWVKSYGDAYKSPEAIALKAWNLEKFLGADKAGRGAIIPKADAPDAEWSAFFKLAGAPDKADGYKLPDQIAADPMAAKFREYAHQTGMPTKMFDNVMKFFGEEVIGSANARQQEQMQSFERQSEKEWGELRSEWQGLEFDKNVELARRAAKAFMPATNEQEFETLMARIEGAIGTKATMKLWASIGSGVGEHGAVWGDAGGGSGANSPEAAKLRIAELKKDTAWTQKFLANDADARREWDRLHQIAHGGKAA